MSIDIDWQTLTGGPDGSALADSIREFIHDRFQKVSLPKMIRSVNVHSFDFGSIAPVIELKDICNPLPDFYDDDTEQEDNESDPNHSKEPTPDAQEDAARSDTANRKRNKDTQSQDRRKEPESLPSLDVRPDNSRPNAHVDRLRYPPGAPGSATPGIHGGTSSLGYFHLPLSAGLSGTSTPLAAVAGAQYHHHPWQDHSSENPNQHHRTTSGSVTSPSVTTPLSRPTSRHNQEWPSPTMEPLHLDGHQSPPLSTHTAERDQSAEDLQIVAHIKYSGNIRMSLTADILLDYPMPSFVGIPLKLNITGMTFDGIAIVAYIKKKAHFCFLSPEDAEALVGGDTDLSMSSDIDPDPFDGGHRTSASSSHKHVGELLEEIKVESEIGNHDSGKQVLKNVGKIERFVLEQVRKIFEDEFVYPSFWTFLV
ncbi:hypothetical protein MBLNU457_2057t1 [Dothideomycetes sp. NU457]